MTKVFVINGSPRKNWNTATLLQKAIEGATSQGAQTELVHLYDLNFKGCVSCFSCKTRGGKSYGCCALKDDLTPLLKRIEEEADSIILGSPIYLGSIAGEMKSFLERLVFPYLAYTDPMSTLFPRQIPAGFIYTMGITEDVMRASGYGWHTGFNELVLSQIFGRAESLISCDAYQFDDYSKVVADRYDPEHKAKHRREVFPKDCEKAFQMGTRLAKNDKL